MVKEFIIIMMEINMMVNIKMIKPKVRIYYYINGNKYDIEWKKAIKEGKVIYYFQNHKQNI